MTTKATRDVIDAKVRPIVDGFRVQGNCDTNDFGLDGVPIGLITPCAGKFESLTVGMGGLQIEGDLNMNGNRVRNAGDAALDDDYVTYRQLKLATGFTQVGYDFIPAGTMVPWPSPTPPDGWLLCDGKKIGAPGSPADYTDPSVVSESLFNTVKQMSPNTGLETWGNLDMTGVVYLPDLQGRIPVGVDASSATVPNLNSSGATHGSKDVTLSEDQLAPHTHVGATTSTSSATSSTYGGGSHEHFSRGSPTCAQGSGDNNLQSCGTSSTWGGGNHEHDFDLPAHSHDLSVSPTGAGDPIDIIQPSIALYWIIKGTPGVIDQAVLLADGSVDMQPGADLNFQGGGEPRGLPSVPGGSTSATSQSYVTTQITADIAAYAAVVNATYVRRDGTTAMTGNLNMNNFRVALVQTPADPQDAANRQYVQDEIPAQVNGFVTHLGPASVQIGGTGTAVDPIVPGPHTTPAPANAILAGNNAIAAILYVKVWDTTPPPSVQISMVFEPGMFPTEMWVPRMDGVNLPAGDILAQQFIVPLPAPGSPLTWDVSAAGLQGEVWLVGYVREL